MRLPSVFRGLSPTFWIIWVATLVDRLGGFAFPFLTLYLTGERHLPIDEATAVLSLGGLGGFVGSLAGGVLADHLGRKTTLVFALGTSGVLMLALAAVRDPWPIAALWLLYGFAGGAARPASSALVADVVPPEDRLRAYGLLHWAVNIGFAIAPVVGGMLAHRSYTGLFVADGLTTFVCAGLIIVRIPHVPAPVQTEPAWRGVTRAFRDPTYLTFLAFAFLLAVIYSQADSSMPVDMVSKGLTPESYGLVIAVNGALIMFLSPIVTGALAKADPSRVLAGAAVLIAIGFALNAVVATAPLYACAVAIWTFGEIAGTPATSAVVARLAPPDQRGRYSGAYTMAWSLARFAGPPAGGLVLARLGSTALWLSCLAVGLIVAVGQLSTAKGMRARSGPKA